MRICILTQNALSAFFSAQSFTATLVAMEPAPESLDIVKGIENDTAIANENQETTTTLPRIVCECSRASIKEYLTGNWTCNARVILETHAADTRAVDNQALAEAVGNLIETTTIAADLIAALSGFTAFMVRLQNCGYEIDGNVWKNYWDLEVDCCAADFA